MKSALASVEKAKARFEKEQAEANLAEAQGILPVDDFLEALRRFGWPAEVFSEASQEWLLVKRFQKTLGGVNRAYQRNSGQVAFPDFMKALVTNRIRPEPQAVAFQSQDQDQNQEVDSKASAPPLDATELRNAMLRSAVMMTDSKEDRPWETSRGSPLKASLLGGFRSKTAGVLVDERSHTSELRGDMLQGSLDEESFLKELIIVSPLRVELHLIGPGQRVDTTALINAIAPIIRISPSHVQEPQCKPLEIGGAPGVKASFSIDNGDKDLESRIRVLSKRQFELHGGTWWIDSVALNRSSENTVESDQSRAAISSAAGTIPGGGGCNGSAEVYENLMHRIRSQIYRRGTELYPVLRELDHTRKRPCRLPLGKVSSALSASLGLVLTEVDYSLLQEKFQAKYEPWERPPAEIDYEAFARAVDVVFNPDIGGVEREFVPCPIAWEREAGRQNVKPCLTRKQAIELYGTLRNLALLCHERRVDLSSLFKEKDEHKSGYITPHELRTVLNLAGYAFKPVPGTLEWETLAAAYAIPGPEIYYPLLLSHVASISPVTPDFLFHAGAPGALGPALLQGPTPIPKDPHRERSHTHSAYGLNRGMVAAPGTPFATEEDRMQPRKYGTPTSNDSTVRSQRSNESNISLGSTAKYPATPPPPALTKASSTERHGSGVAGLGSQRGQGSMSYDAGVSPSARKGQANTSQVTSSLTLELPTGRRSAQSARSNQSSGPLW